MLEALAAERPGAGGAAVARSTLCCSANCCIVCKELSALECEVTAAAATVAAAAVGDKASTAVMMVCVVTVGAAVRCSL